MATFEAKVTSNNQGEFGNVSGAPGEGSGDEQSAIKEGGPLSLEQLGHQGYVSVTTTPRMKLPLNPALPLVSNMSFHLHIN